MIISLTGFMACGKSSVGKCLSELYGADFIDLDCLVEQREGKSVVELFKQGEEVFRKAEAEALRSVLCAPETVPANEITSLGAKDGDVDLVPANLLGSSSEITSSGETDGQVHLVPDHLEDSTSKTTFSGETKERVDLVLSLGGGSLLDPASRELVLSKSFCIWLRASLPEINQRVGPQSSSRPLFKDAEKLFAEREKIYAMAKMSVDTEGLSPHEIALLIHEKLTVLHTDKSQAVQWRV